MILMVSYHTASYMHGAKFKQLFQLWSQIAIAHSSEVIEGEEVKVLSQVTREGVELVQYSKIHTLVMSYFCEKKTYCGGKEKKLTL